MVGLAPFDPKRPLLLIPAGNGGWIVQAHDDRPHMAPETIGAFSNTGDMMAALMAALMPLGDDAAKSAEAA